MQKEATGLVEFDLENGFLLGLLGMMWARVQEQVSRSALCPCPAPLGTFTGRVAWVSGAKNGPSTMVLLMVASTKPAMVDAMAMLIVNKIREDSEFGRVNYPQVRTLCPKRFPRSSAAIPRKS